MPVVKPAIYLLCIATSLACAILLVRSYRRSQVRLLLWSALCFLGLFVNNLLVFVDLMILPRVDLLPLRHASSLVAIGVLLYGFVWETE